MTKPYLCSLIILPTLPTQIIYMLSKEKRREVQYRKLDEEVGTWLVSQPLLTYDNLELFVHVET